MKKRLLSIITATAMTLSIGTGMSSNALYTETSNNGHYDGYKEIEDCWIIAKNNSNEKTFVNSDGTDFILTKKLNDIILFNLSENSSVNDVNSVISDLIGENGGVFRALERAYLGYSFNLKNEITSISDITQNDAKVLCNALKEKGLITDFVLMENRVSESIWTTPYLTTYSGESNKELIEKYINDNSLEFYVSDEYDRKTVSEDMFYPNFTEYGMFYVFPKNEITFEEHMAIAEKIKANLEITPYITSKETMGNEKSGNIDVFNSVDGDANNDGETNMADAVLIMQSLANPDKYGVNGTDDTHITAQGEFNGDMDGNGLTNADALEIQKMLLKLS